MKSLLPVIAIDSEKCVNCHACITVCPVKLCNDGSGKAVSVNHDRCVGCGSCIDACTHDARTGVDDMPGFLSALRRKTRFVALAAPAVVASFPDRFLHLNGWLKSVGVDAVFDVSFGAELTVKTYLDHIASNRPELVIAQPCPAIVSYIELYRPELLPYLAPADSPMMHTIRMIREYYPEYRNHSVMVISPCLAKRREFAELDLDGTVFNVTCNSLLVHFRESGVDLTGYAALEYDNPPAERAVMFSTPGGLLETAEREFPGISAKTRKIEGPDIIYHYLDSLPESLRSGVAPLLVDCLNCECGCNGGPGTPNRKQNRDRIESLVTKRKVSMKQRYAGGIRSGRKKLSATLNRFWKKGLYARGYEDRSASLALNDPGDQALERVYQSTEAISAGFL